VPFFRAPLQSKKLIIFLEKSKSNSKYIEEVAEMMAAPKMTKLA
jgi:hypothetical protein